MSFNDILEKIKKEKYDLRNIGLLEIVHFKLYDCVIPLEELEKVKELIDYSISLIKEEDKGVINNE